MNHLIRVASKEESKIDCCGDIYYCNVDYICSCGLQACYSCMNSHLLDLHWDKEAEEKRKLEELKESAQKKFDAITLEERKVLGLQ